MMKRPWSVSTGDAPDWIDGTRAAARSQRSGVAPRNNAPSARRFGTEGLPKKKTQGGSRGAICFAAMPSTFSKWRPHPWHGLETGAGAPRVVNAFIEITPFDLVKYEV